MNGKGDAKFLLSGKVFLYESAGILLEKREAIEIIYLDSEKIFYETTCKTKPRKSCGEM